MVQLILIRPGATDYDQQERIQGTLDIPLSEAGRLEAAQTAEKLRVYLPKAVYCSPCRSAEETAAIIGKSLELKPKMLDRLQNVNMGLWQGLLVDEVRHKQPKVYKQWQEHPEAVHPPEGEMLGEAVERSEEVLEKLARKHRTGAIALVVPEPLASLVCRRLDGTTLGDLWRASNGCNRLEVLHLDPGLKKPDISTNAEGKTKTNGKNDAPANGNHTITYRGVIVDQP